MVKKLTDNLYIETVIPIKSVISFCYSWKADCHAILKMDGYIDRSTSWNCFQSYDSQIRLWLDQNGEERTIFFGNVLQIKTKMEGNLEQFSVEVLSASCLLDCLISSSSFQNIEKTYGEIVREAVESEGGHVIRNRQSDQPIGVPIIRYDETVWGFAKRLANRLGTFVIPDVVTGRPNFWFGMRKGKDVLALSEEEYTMDINPIGNSIGVRYRVQGKIPYSIGDTMSYINQKLTIIAVEGLYEHGELVFKYVMEDISDRYTVRQENFHTAGLGLWGTVQEVKGELLKITLDIDNNKNTGDYFYPWQPETGNSLYAMPEPGAKVLLYFYDVELKKGAVIHCLNKEEQHHYKDRSMNIADGNQIHIWREEVSLNKGKKHNLTVGDNSISARTQKKIEITAAGLVFLRGKKVRLDTPEEVNISQA